MRNHRFVTLTDEQQQELDEFVWSHVWRIARRGRAILLSNQGFTIEELATIFDVTERSIRNWFDDYEAEGVQGLKDRPRSGRPRSTTAEEDQRIAQEMEQGPGRWEYLLTFWTVAALCWHLVNAVGLPIKPTTLRRRLHELDFRWRRPRLAVARKDPEGSVRMQKIAQRIWEAGSDAAIVCLDSTKLMHLPLLRAMWMRIRQQVRIPTPEDNQYCIIFGALNIITGALTYLVTPDQTRFSVIAFLEHLLLVYPSGPILIILDSAPQHRAADVMKWLARHPRVELLWLPRYAPQLNPIERIWRELKDKVAANRCYLAFEELQQIAERFLDQLTPDDALRLASLKTEKICA